MNRLGYIKGRRKGDTANSYMLSLRVGDDIDYLIRQVELLREYYEAGEAIRLCESHDEFNEYLPTHRADGPRRGKRISKLETMRLEKRIGRRVAAAAAAIEKEVE